MDTHKNVSIIAHMDRLYRTVPTHLRRPLVYASMIVAGVALLLAADGLGRIVRPETVVPASAAQVSALPVPAPVTDPSEPVKSPAEKPNVATTDAEKTPAPATTPAPAAPKSELVGFYVNWDETSYQSLEANIDKMTTVMPMWYHLGNDGRLTVDDPEAQAKAMKLIKAKRPDLKVMPIVNNYDKASESWNAPVVAKMLKTHASRVRIANSIVTTYKQAGFDGVNVDFEGFKADSRQDLVAFMQVLYPIAHKNGLEVSIDVIAGSQTYHHARLADNADYIIPMMYDEHWKTSGAGPIASQAWFEKTLKNLYKQVPPSKIVIATGTYTYDWSAKGGRAKSMTYPKAVAAARWAKTKIGMDSKQMNSRFSYVSNGARHDVWMLDAVSMFNQVSFASKTKPRGYAIWRLGGEDPGIWKVLDERDSLGADDAKELNTPARTVSYDARTGLINGALTRP